MLFDVNALKGEALSFAMAMARGRHPQLFDDVFHRSMASRGVSPDETNKRLLRHPGQGKYVIPLHPLEDTDIDSSYLRYVTQPNESGAIMLMREMHISAEPIQPLNANNTDTIDSINQCAWKSTKVDVSTGVSDFETTADELHLAVYRCYIKSVLGNEVDIPEEYASLCQDTGRPATKP